MFTPEEATTGARNYCTSAGRPFPTNPIYALEDGVATRSRRLPMSAARTQHDLGGKELIAPLLLSCQRKHIPLPARGEKALTTLHNFLTLIIKIR